ncbi:hypothetical protein NBRC116583_34340 [Arenicella sp. 4NH20-0111]
MGRNHDPITLHKYLYANVDPANMVDPTGNFSIGSVSVGGSISGILSTISVATTAFDIFGAATDGDGLTAKEAGIIFLTSLSPGKFLKLFKRGCNSFDSDTLVATENGLRPIHEVKIGDKVWAYNDKTGEKSLQEVTHLIFGEGTKELIDITLETGEVLTATNEHPFYVNNEWVDASDLVEGDYLVSIDDKSIEIEQVKNYRESRDVYNITVDNDHTYYVGVSKVLNHNAQKVCPINGLILGGKKPELEINNKHVGGLRSGGKASGLLPFDHDLAFRLALKAEKQPKKWYAKSTDGKSIYMYTESRGKAHWSASTTDVKSALKFSDIPPAIKRALGFKDSGKLQ